ncbi:MAG TPA: hypothetical protein VFI13_07330 [Gemmatimonadales bacterium]|nr:hypothetical protein [Gemmatimonadales bacterium]
MKLIPPILAAALTLASTACGGGPRAGATTPNGGPAPTGPVVARVAPRGETGPVEVGGIAPNDTIVPVARGKARVVVLRHGPPDRAEFLELTLPATVFAQADRDTIHVTIRTVPGVYGAELTADASWGPGTAIAFKYAIHFFPPSQAMDRYRTVNEVERRLVVARRETNGDLTLYLSTRPSPDVLRALIPGPGVYEMVVGK